jgi:hypothetical protein
MDDLNNLRVECFQTDKCYIITIPKIATSWLVDFFSSNSKYITSDSIDEFHISEMNTISKFDIKRELYINQLNLTISKCYDRFPLTYDYDKVYTDWESIKSGNDIDKDFVFLMRNPVDKFISGLTQDVLLEKFQPEYPKNVDILNSYPNKIELKEFLDFHNNIKLEKDDWWFEETIDWPDPIGNVLDYLIHNLIKDWFDDSKNIANYRNYHKITNIFLYNKILSDIGSKKNIKIVDIGNENLYDVLNSTYNISSSDIRYKTQINKAPDKFKALILKNLKSYKDYLTSILFLDCFLYCDIYNKTYNTNMRIENVWSKFLD